MTNRAEVRHGSPEDDRRIRLIAYRRMQYEADLQAVVPAIEVIARDGVLKLVGTVRTEYEKLMAGSLAANVRSVVAVDNRLLVDPSLRVYRRDYHPTKNPHTAHLAGN